MLAYGYDHSVFCNYHCKLYIRTDAVIFDLARLFCVTNLIMIYMYIIASFYFLLLDNIIARHNDSQK